MKYKIEDKGQKIGIGEGYIFTNNEGYVLGNSVWNLKERCVYYLHEEDELFYINCFVVYPDRKTFLAIKSKNGSNFFYDLKIDEVIKCVFIGEL